jgi:protein-S-isoprenylcysteine O-methyltransferase Ste14
MGIGKFHIAPDPLKSSQLVMRGPYRWIRHPMYLALLLATLPLIVNQPSTLRVVIWLVLLVDLLLKLNYEERLLEARLQGYSEYKKQSFKLIPFIY